MALTFALATKTASTPLQLDNTVATFTSTYADGAYVATPDDVVILEPNTEYYFLLYDIRNIFRTRSKGEDAAKLPGWSIGDGALLRRTGSTDWFQQANPFMISVHVAEVETLVSNLSETERNDRYWVTSRRQYQLGLLAVGRRRHRHRRLHRHLGRHLGLVHAGFGRCGRLAAGHRLLCRRPWRRQVC